MEVLFYHEQEKYERNKPHRNVCKLKLASDSDFLMLISEYYIEYSRLGKKNYLTYEHGLTINKSTGDINVIYRLLNKKENSHMLHKNVMKAQKNNFDMLMEFTSRGFYTGEKRFNFWGVKYKKACLDVYKLIIEDLKIENIQQDKDHNVNPLYDLILEYHLNKKGIKGHDCIYWDICEAYPKKKYLKQNDWKFIPAILDQYGIKTKYLIGALSSRKASIPKINFKSVKFLCTLFGSNYIDYLREFDWETICLEYVKSNKTFVCDNEPEKRALANSLKKYSEVEVITSDGILNTIQDLFMLKEFLKKENLIVKIKANSCHHLISLKDTWELHKKHFKLGYKLKYSLPEEMIEDLEEPIKIGDKLFKPTLILTEDQFKIEGMIMKNCMAKQFSVGSLYIHASVSVGSKRVNIQYRKGHLNQFRGKANSNPSKEFTEAIDIFSKKMEKYKDVTPNKEKYDVITSSKSID